MTEDIKPIAADLRVKLLDLEAGRTTMMAYPKIQPLIAQLELFQEGRPWLEEYLEGVTKSLSTVREHYKRYKKTLNIFYIILLGLALVPIVAFLLKADAIMVFLLSLPVPGWYVLGVRAFIKKNN